MEHLKRFIQRLGIFAPDAAFTLDKLSFSRRVPSWRSQVRCNLGWAAVKRESILILHHMIFPMLDKILLVLYNTLRHSRHQGINLPEDSGWHCYGYFLDSQTLHYP